MDSSRAARILAVATLAVFVLIAILWLWPRGAVAPEAATTATARPERGTATATVAKAPGEPTVVEGPTPAELPGATKDCTTIVDWHRRNVPAWVIEDNMMAQAMKFDDADLACLTAGGLPPQILDFAEQNIQRPQPERREPSTPR